MMPLLFAGFIATRDGKPQQQARLQAAALLQETIEAVRIVRERSWVDFAVDGVFHPVIDDANGTWILAAGSENVGSFTRQLTIEPVQRNQLGEIVDSGGTEDPSSKKITIEVSWSQPLISRLTSTTYVTRYLDNLSFTHSTLTDFEQAGHVNQNTVIVSAPTEEEPDNAFIRLSPLGTGRGNWCEPNPSFVEFDLSGQAQASGIMAFFNETDDRSEVFTTTGSNASGQPLSYVQVSTDYPPQPILAGELSTSPQIKANSVFGIPGYAFLTTDRPKAQIITVDLSTMSEIGYYNAPGSSGGLSVFVKDNTGFVTQSNSLQIFDAGSPSGERGHISSIPLTGNGVKVQVVDNFAYVATDSTSGQLQIFDISNPSSPSLTTTFSVNGGQGKNLTVNESGDRIYLVTANSSTQDEFFIIDTSDPNKQNLNLIASADTGSMNPNAVGVVLNSNRAIIVGEGGDEYQVWSIIYENAPTLCGSLGNLGGIYDIATVVQANGDAYAYITTGQADSELKIIEGGPGGSFALNGWYESAPFDAEKITAFNRFVAEADLPADTTVQYQMAVATPTDQNCTNAAYTFVGPDGSAASYFTGDGVFPFHSTETGYTNPGQCLKYRVYFETANIDHSPLFESILVNYSP